MNKIENRLLLKMDHICKKFSGVRVLDNVHFDLEPGEVHVLAGENGAGKTTLIKILAGIYPDYKGEIWFAASCRGVSVIHQEMSLVNSMTVADNIFLGREKTRCGTWMDYPAQQKAARTLLDRFGIDVNLSRLVEEYPLPVRQMIEIAKALAYEARIFVMDEPTSALTDVEVTRLFEIIAGLKEKGCGVIYISHRMEEIYEIADRITVLRDGEYIGTAAAKDLPADELIRRMVGRSINRQFPERKPGFGKERLRVEHLSLPHPTGARQWLLKNLSFDLKEGEILGIAGLQGSGKSELLHALFGSYGKAVQGDVYLDEKPFKIHSPRKSIGQGLALLTKDRKRTGLVPGLDITRNISLASLDTYSFKGWLLQQKEKEAALNYVTSFDIRSRSIGQEVETLSGGNQQKVVLAKWIETRPKVLLLDEPTLGVDVGAKHEIYRLMNSWTANGMAILLITSELPELLAMSDRIMVMHRGKVSSWFTRRQASQEKITRAAMGEGEQI